MLSQPAQSVPEAHPHLLRLARRATERYLSLPPVMQRIREVGGGSGVGGRHCMYGWPEHLASPAAERHVALLPVLQRFTGLAEGVRCLSKPLSPPPCGARCGMPGSTACPPALSCTSTAKQVGSVGCPGCSTSAGLWSTGRVAASARRPARGYISDGLCTIAGGHLMATPPHLVPAICDQPPTLSLGTFPDALIPYQHIERFMDQQARR